MQYIQKDFNVMGNSWAFIDTFITAVGYHNSHNVSQLAYALSKFCQLYILYQLKKYTKVSGIIRDLIYSTINNVLLTICYNFM